MHLTKESKESTQEFYLHSCINQKIHSVRSTVALQLLLGWLLLLEVALRCAHGLLRCIPVAHRWWLLRWHAHAIIHGHPHRRAVDSLLQGLLRRLADHHRHLLDVPLHWYLPHLQVDRLTVSAGWGHGGVHHGLVDHMHRRQTESQWGAHGHAAGSLGRVILRKLFCAVHLDGVAVVPVKERMLTEKI